MIGQLAAALLPALTPILSAVGAIFAQLAPVVKQLGTALMTLLAPILAQLPVIVRPIVGIFTTLAKGVFPVLSQLIKALAPALGTLGSAFAQIMVALSPVLTALGQLVGSVLKAIMPILTPIIGLIGKLASILANVLAKYVTGIVVPTLKILTSLLRGDFSGAWNQAKTLVGNVGEFLHSLFLKLGVWVMIGINKAVAWIKGLPGRAMSALAPLAGQLWTSATNAFNRFYLAIIAKAGQALAWLRGLPGRMVSALGNLGSLLVNAGRDVVRGLWNGIQSMGSWLRSTLTSWAKNLIPGPIAKALGIASPSKVMARDVGRWIPAGVAAGIASGQGAVEGAMRRLVPVPAVPAMSPAAAAGAAGYGSSAYGRSGGPLLHIENFHNAAGHSPDQTAAALNWRMKARG